MDQIKMKKTALYLALVMAMGLTACSSTKVSDVGSGTAVPPGTQQAISEQRAASDFKREGVRLIYSFTGNLEAVEAVGYAPVWGNSQNAVQQAYEVAYVLAKDRMSSFLHPETITSKRVVDTISKNLEKARDNKTNKFATNKTNDFAFETSDTEAARAGEINREENTAVRNDALNIASNIRTTVSVQRSGILGGVVFKDGRVINDGKNVQVLVRWDRKDNSQRRVVLKEMMQ
jgi:hypothetical protein